MPSGYRCRVVRDDGMEFPTLEAAGRLTYGACNRGAGISRAIQTGGTAGGHHWCYRRDHEPHVVTRCERYWTPWTEAEDVRLATLWPLHGYYWEGWPEALPGRSRQSIKARAQRMGLRSELRRNGWTRSEDRLVLKALLDVASRTGSAPGAVIARMDALRRRQRKMAMEATRDA